MNLKVRIVFVISFLICVMPIKSFAQPDSRPFPASAEDTNRNLVKKLTGEQTEALSKIYPDFRVVDLCAGSFSGPGRNEFVLGIWKPLNGKREVHRVGLIWNKTAWEVHIIDDEIEKDKKLSRSFPFFRWQYSLDSKGFVGRTKCGVETEFRKNSDLTFGLGDKPFFDRKKAGLAKNKVVCYATDDVYNNWDCVLYSPKDRRFRFWFQQANAD